MQEETEKNQKKNLNDYFEAVLNSELSSLRRSPLFEMLVNNQRYAPTTVVVPVKDSEYPIIDKRFSSNKNEIKLSKVFVNNTK